jgi:hypothetical protein
VIGKQFSLVLALGIVSARLCTCRWLGRGLSILTIFQLSCRQLHSFNACERVPPARPAAKREEN